MEELARITPLEIMSVPVGWNGDLSLLLIGKNVINNPKAIRVDDYKNGDIIYYEDDGSNIIEKGIILSD